MSICTIFYIIFFLNVGLFTFFAISAIGDKGSDTWIGKASAVLHELYHSMVTKLKFPLELPRSKYNSFK